MNDFKWSALLTWSNLILTGEMTSDRQREVFVGLQVLTKASAHEFYSFF